MITENWTWPYHSDRKMTMHVPEIFLLDLLDNWDIMLKVFQNAARRWNIKKYTVSWDAAKKVQKIVSHWFRLQETFEKHWCRLYWRLVKHFRISQLEQWTEISLVECFVVSIGVTENIKWYGIIKKNCIR